MRMSTFRGLVSGSVLGMAVGASMMLMPQGRKMKRMLEKSSGVLRKQMLDLWNR